MLDGWLRGTQNWTTSVAQELASRARTRRYPQQREMFRFGRYRNEAYEYVAEKSPCYYFWSSQERKPIRWCDRALQSGSAALKSSCPWRLVPPWNRNQFRPEVGTRPSRITSKPCGSTLGSVFLGVIRDTPHEVTLMRHMFASRACSASSLPKNGAETVRRNRPRRLRTRPWMPEVARRPRTMSTARTAVSVSTNAHNQNGHSTKNRLQPAVYNSRARRNTPQRLPWALRLFLRRNQEPNVACALMPSSMFSVPMLSSLDWCSAQQNEAQLRQREGQREVPSGSHTGSATPLDDFLGDCIRPHREYFRSSAETRKF